MLDLVDESLDQIALFVEVLVVRDGSRAGAVRRDDRLGARVRNGGSKAIGVIALVSEQVFEGEAADQALCLADIGDLACRQNEADRIAKSVNSNADLGAQTAPRTPDRLIFGSPFWAPAACWCARTMVESMIRYSRSGCSPSSVKSRCQTPFFAHRRKRLNTLFQLPKSSGKSRHGAPARTSHNTASTNRRLSAPCRPLSPFLPGISGSIRCHCASVSARRIKIALPSCDLESHSRVRGNPLMSTRPRAIRGARPATDVDLPRLVRRRVSPCRQPGPFAGRRRAHRAGR